MARRSDHSREELRQLAINAGLELIKKDGFSEFSARKVATRIGYSIGTIYNIFGTHDEFLLNINSNILDEWFKEMEEVLKKNRSRDKVKSLARFYIEYAANNYNQWVALFEHHMHDNDKIPEWYVQKMARFFSVLEDQLKGRLKAGRNIGSTARVLWAGIHGICILSLSGKLDIVGSASTQKLIDDFIDNYLESC